MDKKIKKRLIISYHNLSDNLKSTFNEMYPDGYTDFVQKIKKPDGNIIYVVPFETEDTSYMIKVDVRIDERVSEEDFDNTLFNSNDDDNDMEKTDDEGKETNSKIVLMHGDYSAVDRADEPTE